MVIQTTYRDRLLEDLHQGHMGISRMKSVARSYRWWPGMDQELELRARQCRVCQAVRNTPPVLPLQPWKWPDHPWRRVHVDYAERDGMNFLVLIDSHSKWLEVFPTRSKTSQKTIEMLRHVFARYGFPHQLVSDNGPQFTSGEFEIFYQQNGIRQTLIPPHHPASNGAVERAVGILKQALLINVLYCKDGRHHISLQHKLAIFLLQYCSTPRSTTGRAPAELFLGRQLRTRFSLLKHNLQQTVEDKQAQQIRNHDAARVKERIFQKGENVDIKNYRGGLEKWTTGTVVEVKGSRTYVVCSQEGENRHVHADQMLPLVAGARDESPETLPQQPKEGEEERLDKIPRTESLRETEVATGRTPLLPTLAAARVKEGREEHSGEEQSNVMITPSIQATTSARRYPSRSPVHNTTLTLTLTLDIAADADAHMSVIL